MNAPLPYALLQARAHPPTPAGAGVRTVPGAPATQRLVWHSRFGTIEIEVVGETVYVNGAAVHPARPPEQAHT